MWLWGWLGKSEACRSNPWEGQAGVFRHKLKLLFIGGIFSPPGEASALLLNISTNWIKSTQIIEDNLPYLVSIGYRFQSHLQNPFTRDT